MASSALPDIGQSSQAAEFTLRARWLWLAYALYCAILLWLARDALSAFSFRDPDDAMRLQQVRDWLGGQGFYDVSQHRVNPPHGGPMHWSRIIDMPIAALILLLTPWLGTGVAETVACAVAPLLTLAALCYALFVAARRIGEEKLALVAVILLLASPTILVQFTPLRIDHHGWQILLATIGLCGALDPRPVRGGVTAGLALAIWLQISSEGLPYAALFGGVFIMRQWWARGQTGRLTSYAMTLGGSALFGLGLLRGPAALVTPYCDALSSAYVWPLIAYGMATPLAFYLMKPQSARGRFIAAALGGTPAVATFLATGGACLTGDPFQALGPVAYKLWYLKVMEGRPIWEQARSMMGLILLPPMAGLIGSTLAARSAPDKEKLEAWLVLTALLAGATAVALLVMRAMSVAHVLALPGIGWLMLSLFQRAQRRQELLLRVFGSSAVALLAPASLCAIWIVLTAADEKTSDKSTETGCRNGASLSPLRQLPPSNLFAPLDIGPDILIRTGHSVTGTAHHRNAGGITAVVEGFTARPDKARTILARLNGGRGPDYLLTCPGLNEFRHYSKEHRGSLAAELDRGAVPDWLTPLPLPGAKGIRVYRVMLDGKSAPRH